MTTAAPAICAWVLQPLPADLSTTKSKSSWTSEPERLRVVMVFSKGKTLNISSMEMGPGLKSALMPRVLVRAKSVSTPLRARMAVATRLPKGLSPPVAPYLRTLFGAYPTSS